MLRGSKVVARWLPLALLWFVSPVDARLLLVFAVAAGMLWTRPVTLRASRSGGVEGSLGGAAVVVIALLFDPRSAVTAVGVTAVVVSIIERRDGSAAVANVFGRVAQAAASVAVVTAAGSPSVLGVRFVCVATAAVVAQFVASLAVITIFFRLRDGAHPLVTLRQPTLDDWAVLIASNTSLVVLAVATSKTSWVALAALAIPVAALVRGATATKAADRSRAALDTVSQLMPVVVGPNAVEQVAQSLASTARRLLACDHAAVTDSPPPAGSLAAVVDIDGHRRWLVADGTARRFTQADRLLLETIAATGRDLLGAARRAADVAHAANHDPLTGASNRRVLEQRLRVAADVGETYALAFIDLDGFKQVNDRHGHAVGDEVLKVTYARLRDAVRPTDLVVRLGGDEFCALLGPLDNVEESALRAARFVEVLDHPISCGDLVVNVTASIGMVMLTMEGNIDIDHVIDRADNAMYDAKASGKNAWRLSVS